MSKKPRIIMTKVAGSEQVAKVGYDTSTKTLAVEFTSGETYHYEGVEQGTYQELLKAKSFGKCLQSRIVGKYKQQKVKE